MYLLCLILSQPVIVLARILVKMLQYRYCWIEQLSELWCDNVCSQSNKLF